MVRSADGVSPLPKGEACKRCKARKTRCSGERPACTACLRSARFKHLPVNEIVCSYPGDAPEAEDDRDPRELSSSSSHSNKAPRLHLQQESRTSSASSFASTSSSQSTFSVTSNSTVFSVSPGSYETDASSPPLSAGFNSYSNLSLPLQLPPAPMPYYPPIPLRPSTRPLQTSLPPLPIPPRSEPSSISFLASSVQQNLDLSSQHGPPPPPSQSLAARRRGIPLAIPLPQPPPMEAGFVPSSAPPTFGRFVESQQQFDHASEARQARQAHQMQQHQQPSQQQCKGTVRPHQYDSGAVDDWSLPTPVYSGGSDTGAWGGGGGGDPGLPTPLRELEEWNACRPPDHGFPYSGLSLGMSPWPTYAPQADQQWQQQQQQQQQNGSYQ